VLPESAGHVQIDVPRDRVLHGVIRAFVAVQQQSHVDEPAARHGEIRFHRVKYPFSICQRAYVATEGGPFIK
jgi:hypothetical protein